MGLFLNSLGPQPRETLRKRGRVAVDHHGTHYSVYKALFDPYFKIQMVGVLVPMCVCVCVCVISSSLGFPVGLCVVAHANNCTESLRSLLML